MLDRFLGWLDLRGRRKERRNTTIDILAHLTEIILASNKDFFTIGILGQPSAGKRTLAKNLKEQLRPHNRKVETVFVDDSYYIEMMPGIRMRKSNLDRDIREFQQGKQAVIAGESRINPETTVLIFLATFKYLPEDLSAWEELDYRLVITFKDARERLRRKMERDTGSEYSEAELVGEFTQEQLLESGARELVRQADIVWIQDINEFARLSS